MISNFWAIGFLTWKPYLIWFNHKLNLIILDGMMKNCIKSQDVLSQPNGNMLFTMSGFPLCLDNNIWPGTCSWHRTTNFESANPEFFSQNYFHLPKRSYCLKIKIDKKYWYNWLFLPKKTIFNSFISNQLTHFLEKKQDS